MATGDRTHLDGSAGDVNYAAIAPGYTRYRPPDPRIEAAISKALGDAVTVLNVGAGAGSYEPTDREVTAVEPSESMRAQRPAHRVRAIDATSDHLPFADNAFDAAMATFTVHQWPDLEAGLAEVRRVTRGPVVIMTQDPAELRHYWLAEYSPEVIATEARRFPSIDRIAEALGAAPTSAGSSVEVIHVDVPLDCSDGFQEAYYGRPEALLDRGARLANSAWTFVDAADEHRFVEKLSAALASGEWDAAHGDLRTQPSYDGSIRLVVGH